MITQAVWRLWALAFAFVCAIVSGSGIAAEASSRIARVGLLYASDLPELDRQHVEAFVSGLRQAGYVEGRNLILERRVVGGRSEAHGALAASFRENAEDLLKQKVDAIFAPTTAAAYGASLATKTVPIVFATVLDPLRSHLVTSYARPNRNLTGVAITSTAFHVKRLEVLKDALPGLSRVAVLYDDVQRDICGLELTDFKQAAAQLGITPISVPVRSLTDLESAFRNMKQSRIQAILIPYTLALPSSMKSVISLARSYGIPTLHEIPDFAELGGLLTYGPSFSSAYARAGYYVARILNGAKPSQLPVEMPERFELIINLKTARSMGIVLPRPLLARADRIIE